jgi:hypothetical protein
MRLQQNPPTAQQNTPTVPSHTISTQPQTSQQVTQTRSSHRRKRFPLWRKALLGVALISTGAYLAQLIPHWQTAWNRYESFIFTGHAPTLAAYSTDGTRIAVLSPIQESVGHGNFLSRRAKLTIHDSSSGRLLRTFTLNRDGFQQLRFSTDDNTLFLLSNTLSQIDLRNGKMTIEDDVVQARMNLAKDKVALFKKSSLEIRELNSGRTLKSQQLKEPLRTDGSTVICSEDMRFLLWKSVTITNSEASKRPTYVRHLNLIDMDSGGVHQLDSHQSVGHYTTEGLSSMDRNSAVLIADKNLLYVTGYVRKDNYGFGSGIIAIQPEQGKIVTSAWLPDYAWIARIDEARRIYLTNGEQQALFDWTNPFWNALNNPFNPTMATSPDERWQLRQKPFGLAREATPSNPPG